MSESAARLLRAHASAWNERLRRHRVQTPLYVYSVDRVTENYHQLARCFEPEVRVLVALKANPHPALARELARAGASFDTSSACETRTARLAIDGQPQSIISLVRPGKSAQLLQECADEEIDQLVFESSAEITRYASVEAAFKKRPVFLARINPGASSSSANEVMGGIPSQFGIEECDFAEFVKTAERHKLSTEGLHFFLGSQIHSTDEVCANFEVACQSALSLSGLIAISRISLGGGFGIPQFAGDPEVDLIEVAAYARNVLSRISETYSHPVSGQIECGRYVFGDAGVYLCTVLEVKRSKGRTYVIVDCGVTGFSRPIVKWGEAHAIWKLGDDYLHDSGVECTVVGPTCLPGDILGEKVHLERPQEGDVLAVGNAGAYGYTMSLIKWGSLPEAREEVL